MSKLEAVLLNLEAAKNQITAVEQVIREVVKAAEVPEPPPPITPCYCFGFFNHLGVIEISTGWIGFAVRCGYCEATGPRHSSKRAAIQGWNDLRTGACKPKAP